MGEVTIKNRKRFQRQLEKLGSAIIDECKPVLEQNARELEGAIGPDIPRNSGDLEDTLDCYEVAGSDGQAWRVVEGASRASGDKGFWATFQEFGWLGHPGSPHFFFHVRRLRSRFRARLSRAVKRAVLRNFKNGG